MWAINKGKKCEKKQTSQDYGQSKQEFKGYTVVPYVQGLSESYKHILESVGIDVYFKGAQQCSKLVKIVSRPQDGLLSKVVCPREKRYTHTSLQ